jgi:integrase
MAGRTLPRIKTDAGARAAKPDPGGKQVDYRVDGIRGLALRVTPAGTKSWSLRYRTAEGEQRRLTLGTYPEKGLADARTAAQIAIGGVAGGADPAREKRAAKAAAKARKLSTVADLIEAYFEAAARGKHRSRMARPKRSSTLADERSYFDRFIKPNLGNRPIDEVTRAEVQRLIDDIEARSPGAARITRNVIRQAFNFGIMQEAVDRNPAILINVRRWRDRERVLSDEELRLIWTACRAPHEIDGLSLASGTALALQLAMVTLQRGGEVCGIHAREIDRDGRLWIIPGERTKNHRTHVVPLPDAALEILASAFALAMGQPSETWTGYAFPSPHDHSNPITRRALSRAMKRLCRNKAVNVADATPHDFRRTGSTNITSERIGIPRFIVSRVLNQISDTGGAAAVTGVYDRHAYLSEKRRALDAWAALLSEIVGGTKRVANVVRLKG